MTDKLVKLAESQRDFSDQMLDWENTHLVGEVALGLMGNASGAVFLSVLRALGPKSNWGSSYPNDLFGTAIMAGNAKLEKMGMKEELRTRLNKLVEPYIPAIVAEFNRRRK